MTEIILPNDANTLGNLLGGRLMHFIDLTGAMAAYRHSPHARGHRGHGSHRFHSAGACGRSAQSQVKRQSRVYDVDGSGREGLGGKHPQTGSYVHVASAYLVFVAVDENGRRQRVPELNAETADELRRYRGCPAAARASRSRERSAQGRKPGNRRSRRPKRYRPLNQKKAEPQSEPAQQIVNLSKTVIQRMC